MAKGNSKKSALQTSLPYSLEEKYGSTDRHIERVEASVHGYAYVRVRRLAPGISQPCCFCAHDDGGGMCHVRLVVELGVLQLGGEDAYAVRLEERDALIGCARNAGDGEDGTYGASDEVDYQGLSKRKRRHPHLQRPRCGVWRQGCQASPHSPPQR